MDLITTFGLPVLISAVIAYLLGSISFAIPVTKLFTGKDIRTMGSGNAGFTNVLRCVSVPAAVITFIGDFAKGICSVFIGEMIFNVMCGSVPDIEHVAQVGAGVAGLFALLGHLFPLYFGFKGGKGVLISAGIICALDPFCFLSLVVIFLIALAITKTISKCSLTVAVFYPIMTLIFSRRTAIYFFAGFVIYKYLEVDMVFMLVIGLLLAILDFNYGGKEKATEEEQETEVQA